jgi:hypothetical protein
MIKLGDILSGGTVIGINGQEVIIIANENYLAANYLDMIGQITGCSESGYTDWYSPNEEGYPSWFFEQANWNEGFTGLALNYTQQSNSDNQYAIQWYSPLANECLYTFFSQSDGHIYRPIRKITV